MRDCGQKLEKSLYEPSAPFKLAHITVCNTDQFQLFNLSNVRVPEKLYYAIYR